MPLIKITKYAHEKIYDEMQARKAAGEIPRPTFESVVHEMVVDREKKRAKKKS